MTTIRDRRGWLAKLRGLRNRGPATTEEQMEQLRCELDALLEADIAQDAEQRFRVAEGAEVSPEGRAALAKGRSPHFLRHIARLIGGGSSVSRASGALPLRSDGASGLPDGDRSVASRRRAR